MVSSLEIELSKMKVQAHLLEQENHMLKQELEKTKQVWYSIPVPSDIAGWLLMRPALLPELEIASLFKERS